MVEINSINFEEKKKNALRAIVDNIDKELYAALRDVMDIPSQIYEEYSNAKLYFIHLLIIDELYPWTLAKFLKELKHPTIADELEKFATTYNFTNEKSSDLTKPKKEILKLLKYLKDALTNDELMGLRDTNAKTFEHIFADLLLQGKLTPTLEILKEKLKTENREDLAYEVTLQSEIISTLEPETFTRTMRLCLDTLDTDIFQLLTDLKEALLRESFNFHSIDVETHTSILKNEYIPLTFTSKVDTRTLPLTEGSDAELKTLNDNSSQKQEQGHYVNAHDVINSNTSDGKFICITGHPGTGKTIFCRKLINQFAEGENETYRFVLLIACRNSEFKNIEKDFQNAPEKKRDEIIQQLLQIMIPKIPNYQKLIEIIIKTKGDGLLLIIDSFDEFPQSDFPQLDSTVIFKILMRKFLTKATILITSRPGGWNEMLRKYPNYLVIHHSWQVIGFSRDNRNEFIKKMLPKDKISKCNEFFKSKPELNLLSLVPVNISLITQLVNSEVLLSEINTLTDMYTSLVLFTLSKELNRLHSDYSGITCISDLREDLRLEFYMLAEIAYKGLLKRQITFPLDENSEIKKSLGQQNYKVGLGLLHFIPVSTPHQDIVDYLSCPHLTLQEYLSAQHLSHSQKYPENLVSILTEIFEKNNWPAMKVCIRFLCGILPEADDIIKIIIEKLHETSAFISCSALLFDSECYEIHSNISFSHLSVIPYILETIKGTSINPNDQTTHIFHNYYNKLTPPCSQVPHYYLELNLSPVEIYNITEFSTKLKLNFLQTHVSYLCVEISSLSNEKLDTLQTIIENVNIETLVVICRSLSKFERPIKEQLSRYAADIKYAVEHQTISGASDYQKSELVEELRLILDNPHILNILKLKFILVSLQLTVGGLNLQSDSTQYSNLINLIDHKSFRKPKQIYFELQWVDILDNFIMDKLLKKLASTITYLQLKWCYFTPLFFKNFINSQPNLKYLHINDNNLMHIRKLLNEPLDTSSLFQQLYQRDMRGLYLTNVTIISDNLHDYLNIQNNLEEIELINTEYDQLQIPFLIQRLTTLKYLQISQPTTPEAKSLILYMLTANRHTLSYIKFREYKDILKDVLLSQFTNPQCFVKPCYKDLTLLSNSNNSTNYNKDVLLSQFTNLQCIVQPCYNDIMYLLPQCTNLQYIDFSECLLTHHHMQPLSIAIYQLPVLSYIDLSHNNIADTGLTKLCKTINTNNTLRWIDLSKCNITLSSVPVIEFLIKNCTSLQCLDLHGNIINKASKKRLRDFTKEMKQKFVLSLKL